MRSKAWIARVLFQVSPDELRHLEHVDRRLAAKNRFQGGVSVYHAPVFFVLELVLLDIGPQLFGHFGAWERLGADDFGQRRVRRYGSHECGVGFPGGFLCSLFCHAVSSVFQRSTLTMRRGPTPSACAFAALGCSPYLAPQPSTSAAITPSSAVRAVPRATRPP